MTECKHKNPMVAPKQDRDPLVDEVVITLWCGGCGAVKVLGAGGVRWIKPVASRSSDGWRLEELRDARRRAGGIVTLGQFILGTHCIDGPTRRTLSQTFNDLGIVVDDQLSKLIVDEDMHIRNTDDSDG